MRTYGKNSSKMRSGLLGIQWCHLLEVGERCEGDPWALRLVDIDFAGPWTSIAARLKIWALHITRTPTHALLHESAASIMLSRYPASLRAVVQVFRSWQSQQQLSFASSTMIGKAQVSATPTSTLA